MKVCANCFNDEEIKQFIINSSTDVAFCECCGQESIVIDLEEISDFLKELLRLYSKDYSGIPLIDQINKEWNIFYSAKSASSIMSLIIDDNFSFTIHDRVSYLPEIQECFSVWEKLKSEVQEEKRYFSDLGAFNWEIYITSNNQIKKNTELYRTRITPYGRKKLKTNEMGCPPKDKATAGRANPLGIPYLYLCDQPETTYYEVRAVYLDKLSIGKFRTIKDLDIVDFSNKINLFYTYTASESNVSLQDIVKRKILFDGISRDLSKPLRRFDTELEYVPTQLICEYCKQNGADGIRYSSSLHKGGYNIVLFNSEDAKCTSVLSREIKNVMIESK